MKKFTLSLAVMLLAGSSAFANLNALTNGGFEFGELKTEAEYKVAHETADWFYASKKGTLTLSEETSREGRKSIKMNFPAGTATTSRFETYISQNYFRSADFKTTGLKLYFFAKTNKNVSLNVYISGVRVSDGAGANSAKSVSLSSGSGDWKSYIVDIPSIPSTGEVWDFSKPMEIRIAADASQTFTEETTIYIDDLYAIDNAKNTLYFNFSQGFLNTGLYATTGSTPHRSTGFSGLNEEGATGVTINSKLNKTDFIEGDASLESTIDNVGFESYQGKLVQPDARFRVSFYAKASTAGNALMCYGKEIGKDPNMVYEIPLSTAWNKYSVIVNYGAKEITQDVAKQRIRFEMGKAGTLMDCATVDTIHSGNYIVPTVTNIPTSVDLNVSAEGEIVPTVQALDYVKFFYTCSDKDLTITPNGQYGVKLSSSVEKNYTLSVKYTDNITTVTSTVAVKVGNPTNLNNPLVDGRFTIDGSKLIVKADQAEVTINQVNGMVNTYKVVGERSISLSKGINIITIKEADQQPVTVKVGI